MSAVLSGLAFLVTPVGAVAQSIQVAVGANVDILSPHHATTFAEHVVARTLHQGLVRYESGGTLEPGLAESWAVSKDGRLYTFTLKPNATWSDGRPLTSADVVAGFEYALNPANPSPFAAKLFGISNAEDFRFGTLKERESLGVQAPDARTVVIELNQRTSNFLDTLTHPVAMPVLAQQPNLLEDGRVTSGGYRLARSSDEEGLTLASTQGGPDLQVKIIESAQAALDLTADRSPIVTAALPMVTVPAMGERADMVKEDGPSVLYAYGVNMTRPPFNTIEARHALAMAINRKALLNELPLGIGVPADQYVPAALMGELGSYKAPFEPLTLEEREAVASALLAEQGFDRQAPLQVTIRIPAGDVHRVVAETVADMWAMAGIGAEIVEAPLPQHWRALEIGDFDVAFMAWPGRYDTPQGFLEPLSRSGGPWNFPNYAFGDFSDRLMRATSGEEQEDQLSYYREAEKALIEDQALIALFFYEPLYLVSPKVEGWRVNSTGRHPLGTLAVVTPDNSLEIGPPTLPKALPSFGEGP